MKKKIPSWEPDGFFDLSDSDNHAGSLYTIEDMMEILSIPHDNKDLFINLLRKGDFLDNDERIKEPYLHKNKQWKCFMFCCSSELPKQYQTLSEFELIALIKKVYGSDVVIETQEHIGKYYIDIKATIKNKVHYIEFLGPLYHFDDDDMIVKDKNRKAYLEKALDTKIIEWPYWIQFCERNVRIAFGENLQGRGAIWGSEVFFGSSSEKVKNKIINLSKKFNAIHNDGIGYFYELWEENGRIIKPAHPIIEMIKRGKESIDLLLPANLDVEEKKFWLPKELWGQIYL